MNCEKSKNLITISVYGKLTPSEKAQLETHLRECSRCARIFEKSGKLSSLFNEKEDIHLPDKEKSWQIISAKALERKGGWPILFPYKKLAFAASALAVIVILAWIATQIFHGPLYKKDTLTMEEAFVQAFNIHGFMRDQSVQIEPQPALENLYEIEWYAKRIIYSNRRENITDEDIPQIFSQVLQKAASITAEEENGSGEIEFKKKNESLKNHKSYQKFSLI